MSLAQPGSLVLLISADRKRFIVRLEPGGLLHTHRGIVAHDDIIGAPLGRPVQSHNGRRFTVLRPSMEEAMMSVRRATQIVYPKDAGYVLLKLSIAPGTRVIEAGSGSGALTAVLARYVSPGGQVYSYEAREDMHTLARANLARLGFEGAVTFRLADITAGFEERDVDAVFLDVREPWEHLAAVSAALADGGFFGALVPTVNQVIDLVAGLGRGPFDDIEACELMLRQYKTIAPRLRPLDRLTAHTGYLIFARKVSRALAPAEPEPEEPTG
jgi:tRNA (adenine57-N1/adenine58-N1)-methyltransferase